MNKIVKLYFISFVTLLLIGSSCEKTESTGGLTGVWRCSESYSNNDFRTYNVSIDRLDQIDTSTYVIYNMYNLGLDFETYVQLRDTIFQFLGSNSDMYFISGKGVYHSISKSIEWDYSVSGEISDPSVYALYEKR